jgi:protein arginine kinase
MTPDAGRKLPPWVSGTGVSPIISSRVRLARNRAGLRFPGTAGAAELNRVLADVQGFSQDLNRWSYERLPELSPVQRRVYVERGLISRDAAPHPRSVALAKSPDESASLLANEEDHYRLQVTRPGLSLDAALQAAQDLDRRLGHKVQYALHPALGYLTAYPSNVGTGLRVSVLLHLPALGLTQEIPEVLHAVIHVGLAVSGLHGHGADSPSAFFQFSNQVTLGRTEEEITRHLEGVAQQAAEREQKAREKVLREKRVLLEDKLGRALGILAGCRLLELEDALDLISTLRLGADLGLIGAGRARPLRELAWLVQPGHLQALAGKTLHPEELSRNRAERVRDWLKLKAQKL